VDTIKNRQAIKSLEGRPGHFLRDKQKQLIKQNSRPAFGLDKKQPKATFSLLKVARPFSEAYIPAFYKKRKEGNTIEAGLNSRSNKNRIKAGPNDLRIKKKSYRSYSQKYLPRK